MVPRIDLKTKADLDGLLLFLSLLEKRIYKNEPFDLTQLGDKWNEYSWFTQVSNVLSTQANKVPDTIKEIEKWAGGLEQVRLEFPFTPGPQFIGEIYDQIGKLVQKRNFILDIVADKNASAGGKLFYNGQYIDLTIKSKLRDLFNKEDVVGKYL